MHAHVDDGRRHVESPDDHRRLGGEAQHREGAQIAAFDQRPEGVCDHPSVGLGFVDPRHERVNDQLRMRPGDVVEVIGDRTANGLGRVVAEAVQDGKTGQGVVEQPLHAGTPRQPRPHAFRRQAADTFVLVCGERQQAGVRRLVVVPQERTYGELAAHPLGDVLHRIEGLGRTRRPEQLDHRRQRPRRPAGDRGLRTGHVDQARHRRRRVAVAERMPQLSGDQLHSRLQLEAVELWGGPVHEPRRVEALVDSGEATGQVVDDRRIDRVLQRGRHGGDRTASCSKLDERRERVHRRPTIGV